MPFIVGDYEAHLQKMGIIVASNPAKAWRCPKCEVGKLVLTREINGQGQAKPALFVCQTTGCDVATAIYPDSNGGVQPALKGLDPREALRQWARHAAENARHSGYDGRWR